MNVPLADGYMSGLAHPVMLIIIPPNNTAPTPFPITILFIRLLLTFRNYISRSSPGQGNCGNVIELAALAIGYDDERLIVLRGCVIIVVASPDHPELAMT
jgi:hypothetical protein